MNFVYEFYSTEVSKRMKNVLILEDDQAVLTALAQVVENMSDDICVYKARTFEKACFQAFSLHMDLFVLDIILTVKVPGDISGIRLAQEIRKHENYLFTPIIFITALEDPQIYAYKNLRCFGYLSKPFFMKDVKKLIGEALKFHTPPEKEKIVYLRKDGILLAVPVDQVLYVEVRYHILVIHMSDEILEIPYITIKQFLREVHGQGFYQCSRNTVINSKYIKNIDMVNRYVTLWPTGITVEIGPTFRKKFLKELAEIFNE